MDKPGFFIRHRCKLRLLVVFIVILGTTAIAPADTDRIIVVGAKSYAPMEFIDENGKPAGILVDIWKLWSTKTGVEVEHRLVEWSKAMDDVAQHQADVVSGLFYSDQRAGTFDFASPIMEISTSLFYHNNIDGINHVADLHGYRVGVVYDDYAEEYLRATNPDLEIVAFSTTEDMIQAAVSDKIRLFICDTQVGLYYLSRLDKSNNFRYANRPIYENKLLPGIIRGNSALQKTVSKGFNAISTGEVETILQHWIAVPPHRKFSWKWMLGIIGVFGAGAAVILLWSLQLRRRVIVATSDLEKKNVQLMASEKVLRESELRYRTLTENSDDCIIRFDRDFRHLYVNPVVKRLFGIKPGQFIGKTHTQMGFPDDMISTWETALNHVFTTGQKERIEFQLPNRIWIDWLLIPEKSSDGRVLTILTSARDITDRKKTERALQQSEERYRLITANIDDVIWTMTLEFDLLYISSSVDRMLGYKPNELVGVNLGNIVTAQSFIFSRRILEEQLNRGKKTGKYGNTRRLELEMLHKNGTKLWTEITASLMIDARNEPTYLLGVIRDITDRRKAEQEKQILQEKLNRSKKMEALGLLAGGVAHDLNNVLSGIVSYPDLLLMDLPEDSPLKKPIITMRDSGKKAAVIVQDLLTLARRGVTTEEIVNLNDIVKEYFDSPEYLELKRTFVEVNVEVDFESNLPNIIGSSVHLKKTIMNLVSNAAESQSRNGWIYISTQSRYLDRPIRGYDHVNEGDFIVLRVEDAGEGIDKKDLLRIFEPFYTRKVMGKSGTGLGMAVVWGTVQDHKGYIDVVSEKGKGTVFELYFPMSREEKDLRRKETSSNIPRGNRERVLVVDDVKDQREIASDILTKLNYKVTAVRSGEEAVSYLTDNTVDLLVIDMIMDPGIDGLETYRRILELHPGQKAIIASGFAETIRVTEAQALGAGIYVKKPYTLHRIARAVSKELAPH